MINTKIPADPIKKEVLDLLESVHAKNIPNWTSKQKQDVYKLLNSLAFHHFRTEEFSEK